MLNYLETFFSLASTLSYTETAKELHIAQSAVSRQIKLLEENLGVHLFIRTTKSVHLTEQGRDFLMKIKPLYQEIQNSIEETQKNKNEISGIIQMGSTVEAGKHILFPKLVEFQKLHPQVQIQLTLESSTYVKEKVQNGTYDFGFCADSEQLPGLRFFPFYKESAVMICAHRFAKKSLLSQEKIALVQYRGHDSYAEQFLKRNFDKEFRKKIAPLFAVNSHEAIVEVLQNFESVAIIPKSSFEVLSESFPLHSLKEGKDTYQLSVLTPDLPVREKRKKVFLGFLLKNK